MTAERKPDHVSNINVKKIIKLTLIFILIASFIRTSQPTLELSIKKLRGLLIRGQEETVATSGTTSTDELPPIFDRTLMDFDDFNTPSKGRLFSFIFLCLLLVIPFFI
ncbi:hypothetical protein NCAS_0G02190 [Naumovozyma castellii]|uniref:Uncharacterized protein n=1 Tax=Naumovozyma castellii TaxID=27288 RepID=G0VI72_NAUCA|nr:hypothetical protein NCAS_0G02190 [Naumovozyma castellii CBS 4309]CCC71106.1 hypothetical protein NCAS_0G02190 [Naumovozyma castellii CBS 4309]